MTNLVYILNFVGGLFRSLFVQLDRVAFNFIDNSYNLINTFASAELVSNATIKTITTNMYVVIGIFALFRMAVLLVNSILDPDKLNGKESSVTKVFFNFLLVFVFLVATPIVFNFGYEIQKKVVNENYIQRIFINVNELEKSSPGENLKNIAIGSLISIDEKLITDGKTNALCDEDCGEAVEAYNTMLKDGFEFSTISKYVGVSVEGEDGEDIYVYDYPIFISTIVGGFITYILLSFAIDIAVRMVELSVLQILAPMFIITYVDPKSSKSGPFSKWLKTVGKTYLSLFIKLGVLAIMFLLISLIPNIQSSATENEFTGFAKLVLLIGILIFAKKAPKWIGGMFGVEDGIGGLSIGKKIKDGMIGGALASKAGLMGAGAAMGAGRMMWNNSKNRRARKKEARENIGYKRGPGKKARNAREDLLVGLRSQKGKEGARYAAMTNRQALRTAKKEAYADAKVNTGKNIMQGFASVATGAIAGGSASINAKDLKGSLKASYGAANQKAHSLGFKDNGIGQMISEKVKGLPKVIDKAWGNATERWDAKGDIEKDEKVAGWTRNAKAGITLKAGIGEGKMAASQGQFNNAITKNNENSNNYQIKNGDDVLAVDYARAKGYTIAGYDSADKVYKLKDSSGMEIEKVSVEALNKDLNGLIDPSTDFMLQRKKMFNAYQTECLSNYTSNQQSYAQEASTYQNAVTQGNNLGYQAKDMANQILPILSTLSLNGVNLSLNADSIKDLKNSVNDNLDKLNQLAKDEKIAKKEEFRKSRATLEEISEKLEQKEEFDKQAVYSKKNIDTIMEAQSDLKGLVDAMEGKTTAEKSQKLSNASNKINSDLKAFEINKEDKK